MAAPNFHKLLTDARRLPKPSQIKLASALLHVDDMSVNGAALQPLIGLSEAELRALAEAILAPARARRLKQLLRLNREKKLTHTLRTELDALLQESDQLALMKAKAAYTLSLYSA